MAAADWNTIASDLQRAVNNLVWFVLESKAIPEQPQVMASLPLQHWPNLQLPPPPPPQPPQPQPLKPAREESKGPTKKRSTKNHVGQEPILKKRSIGEAVDDLIAETLV